MDARCQLATDHKASAPMPMVERRIKAYTNCNFRLMVMDLRPKTEARSVDALWGTVQERQPGWQHERGLTPGHRMIINPRPVRT